ncbi:hypothetical protein TWF281_010957 [Arthrobotrys megalospora]
MPPSSSNASAMQLPTIADILNGTPRQAPNAVPLARQTVIPREPDAEELVQSATREELQNWMDALIRADSKNGYRIETYHRQNVQLREQKRQRAEAEAAGQANNAGGNTANSTRKRKAETQIAVCIACFKSYDEADNHDMACRTHPGHWEADLDHSMWDDMWEGDFQGRDHDHEDFFHDCPEGFVMECCGQRGDSEGCDVNRHIPRSQMDRDQSSGEAGVGQSVGPSLQSSGSLAQPSPFLLGQSVAIARPDAGASRPHNNEDDSEGQW